LTTPGFIGKGFFLVAFRQAGAVEKSILSWQKEQERNMRDIAAIQPIRLNKALCFDTRPVSGMLLLFGLLLCLGSAFGLTKSLCLTEGCQLYQGYGFLGLSLHIWGAAAFGAALVLLIYRPEFYRRFLHFCLWAEIILLVWQVIYLPCSECLLVGLIWGLLALLEMRERISVKIWSAVFLMALALLGKDLLHPWPVYGRADAEVKVYFSPSCKACRGEIEKLLAGEETNLNRVAFFPVALKADDYDRVEIFQSVLNQTLSLDQAFQACWSGAVHAPLGWPNSVMVRFGLMRNRMILSRMGVNKIPLVVSGSVATRSGLPEGDCRFEGGKDCADTVKGVQPTAQKNQMDRAIILK
jgi:hypothetical protein